MAQNDKRPKRPQPIPSPKGTFKYPKLNKPDYGTDDYPDPDGSFKVKLVLDKDAAATKAFLAKLLPLWNAAIAEGQEKFSALKIESRKKLKHLSEHPLYSEVYDKETEEPTGEIEFNFKMRAAGVRKEKDGSESPWSQAPDIYDARGRLLIGKAVPLIYGGTVGVVSFVPSPFFVAGTGTAGLSYKLKAVQIVNLVTKGNRTASSYGFEAEEGGYEYDPEAFAPEDDGSGEVGDQPSGNAPSLDDEVPF
jgi:hypothetical protein